MLAGRRPFARATAVETLSATIREEPPPSRRSARHSAGARRWSHAASRRGLKTFRFHSRHRDGLDRISTQANDPSAATATVVLTDTSVPTRSTRKLTNRHCTRCRRRRAGPRGRELENAHATSHGHRFTRRAAISRIAVSDVDSSYLGDELAESLINQMSRLTSLQVMAPATAFRFKPGVDPRQVGKELDVGAVLTGSVLRRAGHLTITTALIDFPNRRSAVGRNLQPAVQRSASGAGRDRHRDFRQTETAAVQPREARARRAGHR